MILSIHQPNYLPYIGFFYKMAHCDKFVILDDAQYEKNGFINRNRIRVEDKSRWLTIPVKIRGRSTQRINEVKIDYSNRHIGFENHIRIIEQVYGDTKFLKCFSGAFNVSDAVKNAESLCTINEYLIMYVAGILEIRLGEKMYRSSELDIKSTGTQRLIDICKKFDADTYLSGPGGRKYMDMGLFEKEGIKVIFSDFKCPEYKQQGERFIPNLSIVDGICNIGPKQTRRLLG